jgi:GNAT superfamily N-acetyltransferase
MCHMAIGYVRPANPDDADDIARIQLTTWRVAFRRLLPRHVLDELNAEWLVPQWRDAIASPPSPEHRVLVAVEQAEHKASVAGSGKAYLVGFVASGPADDAARAPDETSNAWGGGVVAITELLVEPRWGRRGHGSRLLAASVDLWRSDGFRTALAWTYRDDAVTQRFLTAAGWAPDGAARALDVDDLLVPQIRLHTSLEASVEQLTEADGQARTVQH